MSQNDFTIANQGFPAFRADLNSALQALASNSSGATAPSTTFANMWWYDSANNIMYIRNEDNDAWIKFAELDQTNDKFVLSGTLQLDDGTVSAPALTFNSDTNMGIYRGGTDILKFVTAGTDAITIDASQNVDIVGTLQVGIDGTTAGEIRLMDSGSVTEEATISSDANGGLIFGGNSGAGELIFRTGSSTKRMDISSGGDISFYEDTGSTPKFFWDSSAESLGLGTASPAHFLDVVAQNAGTDATMRIKTTGTQTYSDAFLYLETAGSGITGIAFGDSADDNVGLINYDHSDNSLYIRTNATRALTIDNSQNLLVGKTANDIATVGHRLGGGGSYASHSRASNPALYVNRNISDGIVIGIQKDGADVGSIGTATRPYFASPDWGVKIGQSGAQGYLEPTNQSGSALDNGINIGASGTRWKDLYLSGGVVFGDAGSSGTSTSNKLDSYEEGTWTPQAFSDTTQITTSLANGFYTVVGNRVFINGAVTRADSASHTLSFFIKNLPFTPASNTSNWSMTGAMWFDKASATDVTAFSFLQNGINSIYAKGVNTSSYVSADNLENNRPVYFSATYMKA